MAGRMPSAEIKLIDKYWKIDWKTVTGSPNFLVFFMNLIENFAKTSKILAKRNYFKISLILLDHNSSSYRPFITWANKKKSVYMKLKNIFHHSHTFS